MVKGIKKLKVSRPNRKKKYIKTIIVKVEEPYYSEIVKYSVIMKISKSEAIRRILQNYFNI